jgi:hypothetical protein
MPQPTAAAGVPSVGEIAAFLEAIARDLEPDLDPPRPVGRGRPRIVPALCVWGSLLLCVLERSTSQRSIWRRIADLGLWHYRPLAVSDQAVYARLERDGVAPMERLFAGVSAALAQRLAAWTRRDLAPWASGVYALDETTLDPLARLLATDTPPRRVPGKLAGRFNLRTQLWERLLLLEDPRQNEKVAARDLLLGLERGSLLLCDLGYFAFQWFDELTQHGFHYISRWRAATSYTVLHTFHAEGDAFDGLVWLGAYRADRAAQAVRLIQFRHGGVLRRYRTNVLEPATLSPQAVAALYARRWDIELAIKLVKTHLGVSVWWSTKDVVIQQQLWAVLTIAQVLQGLRLEIAGRAEVDPYDVSMAMLVEQLPQYAARGWDPIVTFLERGRRMGYIRPARRLRIDVAGFDPATYLPPPPDLVTTRRPRYAQRHSLHRPVTTI